MEEVFLVTVLDCLVGEPFLFDTTSVSCVSTLLDEEVYDSVRIIVWFWPDLLDNGVLDRTLFLELDLDGDRGVVLGRVGSLALN